MMMGMSLLNIIWAAIGAFALAVIHHLTALFVSHLLTAKHDRYKAIVAERASLFEEPLIGDLNELGAKPAEIVRERASFNLKRALRSRLDKIVTWMRA